MTRSANDDEHVLLQLGFYVLGALPADEHRAVIEHLGRCRDCYAESVELSEVPLFLSLLTTEDVEELARALADSPEPSAAAGAVPAPRVLPAPDQPFESPATAPSGRPSRPPSVDSTRSRPGRGRLWLTRRPRFTTRSRLVVSAIAVALVMGVGIGVWLNDSGPQAITLAGSQTDSTTGVTMSVTVVGQAGESHVEATVTGLQAGLGYQLYAVDRHGDTSVVARWTADGGPYTFSGDIGGVPDDIAFFTVTLVGGSVVVTVRVARSGHNTTAAGGSVVRTVEESPIYQLLPQGAQRIIRA